MASFCQQQKSANPFGGTDLTTRGQSVKVRLQVAVTTFAPPAAKPRSTSPKPEKAGDLARTAHLSAGHQAASRFIAPEASLRGNVPGTKAWVRRRRPSRA